MRGVHHIEISSRYLKYEFDLRRNITVIRGNSATGKTTLVEMIRTYSEIGKDSGINLSCDVQCRVLEGNLWEEQLLFCRNSIVFVDEGNDFIKSQKFAECIKNSSNYYVLVTRENLDMLPVSVDEIYGIKSSGKYGGLEPVYHEFYRLFDFENNQTEKYPVKPDKFIIEDSNSGFQFLRRDFCTAH
ncbi:MAG: Fis family transcriptional regulator [Oscillospiraceae bacterium]|nr:hypothetical protein [Oscillospiraceae bacterium]